MSTLEIDLKNVKTKEHTAKVVFTYEQLAAMPEWPISPLLEIIHGELFMPPSPSIYHHDIRARLVAQIRTQLDEHRVFNAPVDVVLSPENVVIPDIFVVRKEGSSIITEKNIEGTPDLIIEILSQNRENDLQIKRNLYEQFSVKEYWIVDPENKTIQLLVLKSVEGTSKLVEEERFTIQQVLNSVLFPDLSIVLGEIF